MLNFIKFLTGFIVSPFAVVTALLACVSIGLAFVLYSVVDILIPNKDGNSSASKLLDAFGKIIDRYRKDWEG